MKLLKFYFLLSILICFNAYSSEKLKFYDAKQSDGYSFNFIYHPEKYPICCLWVCLLSCLSKYPEQRILIYNCAKYMTASQLIKIVGEQIPNFENQKTELRDLYGNKIRGDKLDLSEMKGGSCDIVIECWLTDDKAED